MIKFFRKIRQKMLIENKFSKYLLYAIGEIVLVVIGILIAFQVSNWSKQKERDTLERRTLTEMLSNLKMDSMDMSGNIKRNTISLESAEAVLYQLENRIAWNDSMANHYSRLLNYNSIVAPILSSYENLKSSGFDLIKNDNLRFKIHQLYAQQYPFLGRLEQEHGESLRYSVIAPQVTGKIKTFSSKGSRPVDLTALMDDHAFKESIILFIGAQKLMISFYNRSLVLQVELSKMIEQELK